MGLISLAERRRFRGADAKFAHWSHTALVVSDDGALVEAESSGVALNSIERYRDDEYHLVRLGPEFSAASRELSVDYARAQVGQGFGYLAALSAAVFLVFGVPLRISRGKHQICSELVVHALQKGGLLLDADAQMVLPADLARIYRASP